MTLTESNDALEQRLKHYDTDKCTPQEALALFDAARGRCPVAYSEERGGYYLLMGYHDVKNAHKNWAQFSTEPSIMRPLSDKPPLPPLEYHPPVHTHWRRLFVEAFSNKTPDRIETEVQADIASRIDDFADRGECELISEFIKPIPVNALCMVLGITPNSEKARHFHHLANNFIANFSKPEEFPIHLQAIMEFGVAEVLSRREHPADDYLTWLANADIEGKPLGPEEIGPIMASMLVAGHETSVNGLAGVLYEVLRRPDIRDELRANPELVRAAVDEGMRLHPPFFGFYRRTLGDVDVTGVHIPSGADVQVCWAAANRDPEVFPEPGEFRLDRETGRNRHMSFGFGIHACPGQATAQMEMRIAVTELLRRLPDIELVEPEKVKFNFTGGESCGINELRVRFTPVKTRP